jgi:hypothetical protein
MENLKEKIRYKQTEKNISDIYKGIYYFKKVYRPRNDILKR